MIVDRMADSLAAIGFHNYGQTFTDTRGKAEEMRRGLSASPKWPAAPPRSHGPPGPAESVR